MKFQPGDKVRVIKEPFFVGGRGSDWMTVAHDSGPESFLVRYDMTHLIGVEATVRGHRPNLFLGKRSVEEQYGGWWMLDWPPGTKIPVGLASEGLEEEYLEKIL